MSIEIVETTEAAYKELIESLEIKEGGLNQFLKPDTTYRIINGWLVRWDGVPIRKI